jgi:hypothetical protein
MVPVDLIFVPKRLPFAPRPLAGELLSSWLERVAAANVLAVNELVEALWLRYGELNSRERQDREQY